jgi:D-alanyl-D-alanine dipeptidase
MEFLKKYPEINFMGEKIYDCAECYLRTEVAQAIARVHRALKTKGYGGLKMYDCYRPHSAQWKLWKKVPNPQYVADPRKGSMHNRGSAVDLTVIDKNGKELDMGTGYDVFDKKAYIDYIGHSATVNNNRKLLQETMIAEGFRTTRTEWWHFSYTKKSYEISDFQWKCE